MNFGEIRKNPALSFLGLWFFLSALAACATPGEVPGMIPDAFESKKKYSQPVRKKSPAGRMMKPLDDHKFRMQLLSKQWRPLSVASKFFQR